MESAGGEGRLKQGMWGTASDWAHLPVCLLLFLLSLNKIWACLKATVFFIINIPRSEDEEQ